MDWSILLITGLLEVAWAIGLKYTEGLPSSFRPCSRSRPWPAA
ncbi:multidrug transporter EmrE-like cation transporter [Bradyrhizobium sp. i1.3.1]